MNLTIKLEIDMEESGLQEEDVKNEIIPFTRDLLILGAAEQEISFTLREVDYEI